MKVPAILTFDEKRGDEVRVDSQDNFCDKDVYKFHEKRNGKYYYLYAGSTAVGVGD